MIIAIYKRGECVFEQRLHRENNYEAVISINTLTVKYLQNINSELFQMQKEVLAPNSGPDLWKIVKKVKLASARHEFSVPIL